ncbi:osmoprotectant ABC transporter substrate-binding protein [Enterococcus xiangfangensis]|uniref:osmoprotectant ABC transporter substrate-binding protein n=1 Tax=Enterococcus xiangfangensis TaxID=1296537 RepID=UPI0010F46096|nr:osmoprotectant ABC transporter substrate-binding protein [Enterococcus xiangfangensis]MBM7711003.1 osmoprotectant transport system substrate-binding protein [Enterococcus xiangfangensis]
MKKRTVLLVVMALLFGSFIIQNFSTKDDTITVAGGVTSESQILGNIVVELLKHSTDKNIVYLNNLGSANLMHEAMVRGDLNVAPTRYTGTDLIGTLGLPTEKDPNKALAIVQREFDRRFGFEWFPSYGFSNQFTFMVTQETANKYGLKKVSDLQKYAGKMRLGSDQTWYKREGDGYKGYTEAYKTKFQRVYPMQVGLLYDALVANELDVILGYSTDGRVGSYNLVMLEDDLHFFPPYTCSVVVSDATLKKYPELKPILLKLQGTIDTETMQQLNYESDNELIEPKIVAQRFLEKHNFFEEGS